jgi:aminopeptidase N
LNFVIESTPDFTQTSPDEWLFQDQGSITLRPNELRTWTNDEWLIFNKQQTGYYRVNYDDKLWQLFINELLNGDYTKIHVLNRAQLIDDAHSFAENSLISYDIVFHLLEYLSKELDYIPWVVADKVFTNLNRLLSGSNGYENFRVTYFQLLQSLSH